MKTMIAMSCIALLSTNALADNTIAYRSSGGCAGDFERVELKSHWLRVDAGDAGNASSMIYDHAEKLAYFVDYQTHTFMQVEMDEDAIDLQSDIMKSLGTKMRKQGGVDPFEMAKSLCPGIGANNRDRQPGEAMDCGNGTMIGGAPIGADGKPMSSEEMAAAMKDGRMPGMDAASMEAMQKMMEQQLAKLPADQRAQMQSMMASGGGSMSMPGMPAATATKAAAPPPPRIDRDAGEIVVDGIACMRREHLRGEEMLREDCYATAATLHLGEVETRRMARFSKSLQEWSRSMMPAGMQSQADDRVLVRRVCYMAGRESGRATLTIESAPIAESRFEVPAGYKPMDLGMGSSRNSGSD